MCKTLDIRLKLFVETGFEKGRDLENGRRFER